jgi:hypothetical protein
MFIVGFEGDMAEECGQSLEAAKGTLKKKTKPKQSKPGSSP